MLALGKTKKEAPDFALVKKREMIARFHGGWVPLNKLCPEMQPFSPDPASWNATLLRVFFKPRDQDGKGNQFKIHCLECKSSQDRVLFLEELQAKEKNKLYKGP